MEFQLAVISADAIDLGHDVSEDTSQPRQFCFHVSIETCALVVALSDASIAEIGENAGSNLECC